MSDQMPTPADRYLYSEWVRLRKNIVFLNKNILVINDCILGLTAADAGSDELPFREEEIKAASKQFTRSVWGRNILLAKLGVINAMMDARAADIVSRNSNTEEAAAVAVAAINILREAEKAVIVAEAAGF